jgi:hypothetical protein
VGKGIEMRSVDLIDCQEGDREIPYFQVGRDEQMRLFEGLINSEVSLNHLEELTEEEYQKNLLMIGGIQIFVPFSKEEVEICVVDVATEAGQPSETVKEALEQTWEVAQEEKENEHSDECLNAFS